MNVDYNQQKVTVWGICNKYDVLTTMRNKRKEARFWNEEDSMETEEPEPMNDPKTMTLTRVRSLSWKAWRRIFKRSYSF